MKKTLLILIILASSLMSSFGEDLVDAKILKYIKIIRKNPGNANLFKRFYRQWLSQNSMTELEIFLKKQTSEMEAGGAELLLAHLYVVSHQNIKAQKALNESIKKNPRLSFSFHLKADLESLNADYKLAATNYLKAFELAKKESRKIKILKSLSKVYIRNREFKKAKETFEKLQKEAGEDEALREEIMEIQIEESLYKQAVETCDRLMVKTKSKYKRVLFQLRKGDIYLMQHKKTKAVEIYVACLDLVETGGWVERQIISQIQKAYRSSNDLVGLIKQFKKVSAKYPKNINVQKQLALITLENGNEDEALAIFQKIIKLSPGDVALRDAFLSFLKKAGKTEEVLQQYKTMIEANPTDSSLILSYAIACHEDEKLEQSKASMLTYLNVSKKTVGNYMRVTSLLERFDFDDTSLDVIAKGISLFPDNMELKEIQLNLLYKNKQGNKANGLLKELAKSADEGVFLRFIGLAEMNEGRKFALEIIEENKSRFKENFLFNQKHMQLLINLKKYKEAYPVSRQLLVVSKGAGDLWQTCLKIYYIIHKEDRLDEIIDKLKENIKNLNEKDTCLLIFLLNKSGLFVEEVDTLKEALRDNKKSILLLETKFRLAKLNGNTQEQLSTINQILMYFPEKKALYLPKLIATHMSLRNSEMALKIIREWKQMNKGSITPYLKECSVYESTYRLKKAIRVIREGLRKFSKNDILRKKLADLYLQEGKPSEARNIYWLMIDDNDSLNAKITIFKDLCEINSSEDDSRILLQELKARQVKNINEPFLLLGQAFVYGYLNEYEERRNVLLKAAEMNKDSVLILHMLAKISKDDEQLHESELFLNQADKIDQTKKTKQLKAKLYFEMGETEKVNLIIEELLSNQLLDEKFILDHAFKLMIGNNIEKALAILNKELQRKPNSYRLLMLKAYGFEELKENKKALEIYLSIFNLKNKKSKRANWRNQYVSSSLYPAKLSNFYRLSGYRYEAYEYKEYFDRSAGFFYGGMKYPPSLEAAKYFALAHMAQFAKEMTKEEKTEVIDYLKSHAVPYLDVFFAFALEADEELQVYKSLEKKYRADPIYYYLTNVSMNRKKPERWIEQLTKSFEHSYPKLIIQGYLDVMSLSRRKSKQNKTILEGFVNVLEKSTLSSEEQVKLKFEALGHHRIWRMTKNSFTPQIVSLVASIQKQRKFLKPYEIDQLDRWHVYKLLLDKKFENAITLVNKLSKIVPVNRRHHYGGWNRESSFNNITLSSRLLNVDYHLMRIFERSFLKIKKEELKPFVKRIEHNSLRFWLMISCEFDKKELENAAKTLAKSSHVDSLLLGATWLKENGWEKLAILKMYDKARHLPISRSKRKMIDSGILFFVADYLKEAEIQEFIKPVVKRYLRYSLSEGEENALVYYYEALGMTSEIDQFDKQQALKSKKKSRKNWWAPYISENYAIKNINKLLDSGKKQKAINAVTKLYRKEIKKTFNLTINELNEGIYQHLDRKFRLGNALSIIQEHSFEKDVLRNLKLKDGQKDRTSLLIYARAEENFGEKEKAQDIYKQLIRRDSNDIISIVHLHILDKTLKNKPILFKQVSVDKVEYFIYYYLYSFNLYPKDRGVLFKQIEPIFQLIEDQSVEFKPTFTKKLLLVLLQMITQNEDRYGMVILPILFSEVSLKKFLKNADLREEDVKPLIEKRDKLYLRYCQMVLSNPKSFDKGVKLLIRFYTSRKKDLKPLFLKFLSYLKQKQFIKPILKKASYPYYIRIERAPGVIVFLFEYAYVNQEEKALKECLQIVYQINPDCPLIRNYEMVYDLPQEGFFDALDKIKLLSSEKEKPVSKVVKDILAIATIIDRKFELDYHHYLLKKVSDGEFENYTASLDRYLHSPLLRNKPKKQVEFISELFEIMFKKYPEKLPVEFNDWDKGLQKNCHMLFNIIESTLESGAPVLAIYQMFEESSKLRKINNNGYIRFINRKSNFESMNLSDLQKTHLLDELSTINFYGIFVDTKATKDSPKKSEIQFTIANNILEGTCDFYYQRGRYSRKYRSGLRREFLRYYKKKKLKTFGDNLFYFCLKDKKKETMKLINDNFEIIQNKDKQWLDSFFKFFEKEELFSIDGFEKSKVTMMYNKRCLPGYLKKIEAFMKVGGQSDISNLTDTNKLVQICIENGLQDKALTIAKKLDDLFRRKDMKQYRYHNAFISQINQMEINEVGLFIDFTMQLMKQVRSRRGIDSICRAINYKMPDPEEGADFKLLKDGTKIIKTTVELQRQGKKYFNRYRKEILEPLVKLMGNKFYLPLNSGHNYVIEHLDSFESTGLLDVWLKQKKELTPQLKEVQLALKIFYSKEIDRKAHQKKLSNFYFKILKTHQNKFLKFHLILKLLNEVDLKTANKEVEEYLIEEFYQYWLLNKSYDESLFVSLLNFWHVESKVDKNNKTWKKVFVQLKKNFLKCKWPSGYGFDGVARDGRKILSIKEKLNLFEVSFKHDQNDFFDALIASDRFRIRKSYIYLPLFVKYDLKEYFVNIFVKYHKNLNIDFFLTPDPCYKNLRIPNFEIKAEKMISVITDPELQFYSKVIMSRFAHSMGTPSVGAYLNQKTLIDQIGSIKFKNNEIKMNCLVSLASEELFLNPTFKKDYQQLLKQYNFYFLSEKDSLLKNPLTILAAKPLVDLLKKGKVSAFDALMSKTVSSRRRRNYYFPKVYFRLYSRGFKGFDGFAKDSTKIYVRLCESWIFYGDPDLEGFQLLLISGMLAGREGEIKKFNEVVDDDLTEVDLDAKDDTDDQIKIYTKNCYYSITPESLFKTISELAAITDEVQKKRFKEVFIKMIQSKTIVNYMTPSENLGLFLTELKIMYNEEELSEIKKLIKQIKSDPLLKKKVSSN